MIKETSGLGDFQSLCQANSYFFLSLSAIRSLRFENVATPLDERNMIHGRRYLLAIYQEWRAHDSGASEKPRIPAKSHSHLPKSAEDLLNIAVGENSINPPGVEMKGHKLTRNEYAALAQWQKAVLRTMNILLCSRQSLGHRASRFR